MSYEITLQIKKPNGIIRRFFKRPARVKIVSTIHAGDAFSASNAAIKTAERKGYIVTKIIGVSNV